jgi:hypothetical protein
MPIAIDERCTIMAHAGRSPDAVRDRTATELELAHALFRSPTPRPTVAPLKEPEGCLLSKELLAQTLSIMRKELCKVSVVR